MGKKSAPDAPPPPDPMEVARADAEFNRIDTFTPYGNLTYSGPNRNQATLQLSPEMQQAFGLQSDIDITALTRGLGLLNQMDVNPIDPSQFYAQGDAGFNPFAFSGPDMQFNIPDAGNIQMQLQGLEGLPEIPTDFEGLRNNVEDAYFNRQSRLLDPQFQQQQARLEQQLASSGLPGGGEAAVEAVRNFTDRQGRTYADLADASVLRGGEEAQRQLGMALAGRGQLFNEALAGGQFANAAQQQLFGQNLMGADFFNNARNTLYGQQFGENQYANQLAQMDLTNFNAAQGQNFNLENMVDTNQFNQMAGLLGLQQLQQPQLNSFFQPGQVDYLGAQGLNSQMAMNNYNQAMANRGGFMQGLFGLGSAFLMGPGSNWFAPKGP